MCLPNHKPQIHISNKRTQQDCDLVILESRDIDEGIQKSLRFARSFSNCMRKFSKDSFHI